MTHADALHRLIFGGHSHPCPSAHCAGALRPCSEQYDCQPVPKLCADCFAALDSDKCAFCGQREYPGEGDTQVQECRGCDVPCCASCAEVDYDFVGDPGSYVCCCWSCPRCAHPDQAVAS